MKLHEILEKDNLIIICNNDLKHKLIARSNGLKNIIYKTYKEFSTDLLGEYKKFAYLKLSKEENINPEFTNIKLKNSLIVNKQTNSEKVNNLYTIKNDYQKYLDLNPLIMNLYKNREVIIIDELITSDEYYLAYSLLTEVNENVKIIDLKEEQKKEFKVFEFNNYKEEVNNLLIQIGRLIEEGVNAEKIKVEVPASYYPYMEEVFSLANIALNIEENKSLSSYEITKKIINELNSLKSMNATDAFSYLIEEYSSYDNEIFKKIVRVFNSYLKWDFKIGEIYEDLLYTLKLTSYSPKYLGGISVGKLNNKFIEENDYVFILGLNQDVYPVVVRDDEYLLDYERKELGLLTSGEKNDIVSKYTLKFLKNVKNLYLSYANLTPEGVKPISSIVSILEENCKVNITKQKSEELVFYSRRLGEIELGKHLDLFYKYDVKSEKLISLNNEFKNNLYRKYDNSFDMIDPSVLENYLANGLNLSYTAIDKYYKCGFLFYLENVLKIKRVGNEESLFIGSLVHDVLYEIFSAEKIDNLKEFMTGVVSDYLSKNNYELAKKEKFFVDKYLNVLVHLFNFIKSFDQNSSFKIYGLEKEFRLTLSDNVHLKGFIDKVLTVKIEDVNYAIVVDYKTGSTDFDLNLIVHGLNMQIMFYFYFLNNSGAKKYKFAGGYLQGVLPTNPFGYEENKTYLEQLYDHFKLSGYSNSDKEILNLIDQNIETTSKYIKGIRFKNDGSFYSTTLKRVIDNETFSRLLNFTEEKITDAVSNIKKGNFKINPKQVGNFDSCIYCPYQDLCFRTNRDYEVLEKYEDFEFLGGKDDSN